MINPVLVAKKQALEAALKRKREELRQLCLKEAVSILQKLCYICAYCNSDNTRSLSVCGFIQNKLRYSLVVDIVRQAMYNI